jgi:hypothetical protein
VIECDPTASAEVEHDACPLLFTCPLVQTVEDPSLNVTVPPSRFSVEDVSETVADSVTD